MTGDSARKEAKKAEVDIRDGKYLGPLHGIPVSLKDLIYVTRSKKYQWLKDTFGLCA